LEKQKQTVFHIISSLSQFGGAERLLAGSLSALSEKYENFVITLSEPSQRNNLKHAKHVSLNAKGLGGFFTALVQLKLLIKKHKPCIIHSHLFWPTIIARLARTKKTPYLFTLHSMMGADAFERNVFYKFFEKITYNRTQYILAISNEVLKDYDKWIGIKGPSTVLYNYIENDFFDSGNVELDYSDGFRLVAVGNIKPLKNYRRLISAIAQISNVPLSLDIYGSGPEQKELQQYVNELKVPVNFKGSHTQIVNVLPRYNVFILPSIYEGFGIAVVEAMAMGLPVLVSNLSSLREVTGGHALYFDPANIDSIADCIRNAWENRDNLPTLAQNAQRRAAEISKKETYIEHLKSIYSSVSTPCVE